MNFKIFRIVIATIFSLIDPITDISVIINFFLGGDTNFGYISLVSLCLSGFVQSFLVIATRVVKFSFKFCAQSLKSLFIVLLHFIGFSQIFYSSNTIRQINNGDNEKEIQLNDSAGKGSKFMQLVEILIEAIPQLFIQSFAAFELGKFNMNSIDIYLLISIISSLLSIAYFHLSFTKSQLLLKDTEYSFLKLILIAFLRFFEAGSFVFAHILMASIIRDYIFETLLIEIFLTSFILFFFEENKRKQNCLLLYFSSIGYALIEIFFIGFNLDNNKNYSFTLKPIRVILSFILRLIIYVATIILVLIYGETIFLRDDCTGNDCWSYSFIYPLAFYLFIIMSIFFIILYPFTYWICSDLSDSTKSLSRPSTSNNSKSQSEKDYI